MSPQNDADYIWSFEATEAGLAQAKRVYDEADRLFNIHTLTGVSLSLPPVIGSGRGLMCFVIDKTSPKAGEALAYCDSVAESPELALAAGLTLIQMIENVWQTGRHFATGPGVGELLSMALAVWAVRRAEQSAPLN